MQNALLIYACSVQKLRGKSCPWNGKNYVIWNLHAKFTHFWIQEKNALVSWHIFILLFILKSLQIYREFQDSAQNLHDNFTQMAQSLTFYSPHVLQCFSFYIIHITFGGLLKVGCRFKPLNTEYFLFSDNNKGVVQVLNQKINFNIMLSSNLQDLITYC